MYRALRFRYRGYLTIIRYFDDETCVAVTLRTDGSVHYYCDFWSFVMLDVITSRIDSHIESLSYFSDQDHSQGIPEATTLE